ncbi:MAG: DUF2284 domain-containing protein [Chloroflexi bacterium]|nr:DUF2284 domain-containing protein [Chloroflexota bacterium]
MMIEREQSLESYLKFLCQKALELGASEAVTIPVTDIVIDERTRLKCLVPLCSFYDINLMCPPNVMPISEFKEILKRYHGAILIKTDTTPTSPPEELTDPVGLAEAWEIVKSARKNISERQTVITDYSHALRDNQERLYKIIEQIESLCIREGYHFAAGFAAGACLLCDECVGVKSGLPCRYPFKARTSMGALGIDVVITAKRAGLKVNFAHNEVRSCIGMILVD